ncbi:ABA4-like family protein [Histidinibacterium aquaticum]|nr:ABA4-like family protein [Histidinibacterium aquaticum]
MSPDRLFDLANTLALAGWVVLLFAPRRWPGVTHVPRWGIPIALSALYAGLMLAYFDQAGGSYGSIAEVRQLFASDEVLVAGWTHYLTFDLMIGALMAERLDGAEVSRLVQAPVLACIFLFGPLGVLLSLGTEAAMRGGPLLRRIGGAA